MLTKSTGKIANDLGLKNILSGGTKDERAYGIYRRYLVSIYEKDGKRNALFSCPFDTEEDSVFAYEFSQALTESLNEFAHCVVTVDSNGVGVTTQSDIVAFRNIIDTTIDMLEANDIPCSDCCAKCGSTFGNGNVMIMNASGNLSLLCEGCALSESLEINKKKSREKATVKQRRNGVLGALLGALIGFGFILGISYIVNTFIKTEVSLSIGISALCFIAAAISYLFSKVFCSVKDIPVSVAVCGFSLVFNAIARIITTAYSILIANGFVLSDAFAATGAFFRLPFTTSQPNVDIYEALIIDLLFGLVSLAIFAFGLFGSGKKGEISIEPFKK